ncbi:MAG TPA: hypothetical protein VFD82_10010 [Planctomycetota bacterium]|nr:hypothetical protein [Planctomycetota bacterium]
MTTTILLLWCLGAILLAPLVGRVLRGSQDACPLPGELVQPVGRPHDDRNGNGEQVA